MYPYGLICLNEERVVGINEMNPWRFQDVGKACTKFNRKSGACLYPVEFNKCGLVVADQGKVPSSDSREFLQNPSLFLALVIA